MKRYLGVDLHRNYFTVSARREDGRGMSRTWAIRSLPTFAKTITAADAVAAEATGNGRLFCAALHRRGCRVVVNHRQCEVISRLVMKTDTHDAELLAEFLAKGLLPQGIDTNLGADQHALPPMENREPTAKNWAALLAGCPFPTPLSVSSARVASGWESSLGAVRLRPHLLQLFLQVPQSPLENLALLVQPLDVLLASQEAMPSSVMRRALPLRVAGALLPALVAAAVMTVMVAVARPVVVMTAAARHVRPPFAPSPSDVGAGPCVFIKRRSPSHRITHGREGSTQRSAHPPSSNAGGRGEEVSGGRIAH